jgi:small-conductance mechanosensitive channel
METGSTESFIDVLLEWAPAIGTLIGGLLVGYLARPILLRRIEALTRRTETDLDDLVIKATRKHIPFWFFLGGAVLAAHLAPSAERLIGPVGTVVKALFVLSISLVASHLAIGLLERSVAGGGASVAQTSVMRNVVRIVILVIAVLFFLPQLGINITPLITALGVGSLAVALALQPTLTNLFAGVHMAITRPIRVGDMIELEDGRKGTVVDIGWRLTRILEITNNQIVVPNARLAEMIVRNYALPDPELAVLVDVGVAYSSDLDRVERVTGEVAQHVQRKFGGDAITFVPTVRFHTFADSSINATVALRARGFGDAALVKHELVKRLKHRYETEGIEIPFPQQVVHTAGASDGRR